jgi:hypothetical protein
MQLLEPFDLVLCKGFVREVGQRCPAPERERTAKLIRRFHGISGFERGPALREQPLEAVAVQLVTLEREPVRAGDRLDGVGRQFLAQCRDGVLEHLCGGRWSVLAPELVDDHVPCQWGRRSTMRRRYFRLKRIALGLAFAAVAVPTAQAKPVPYTTPVSQHPIASEISVQSPVSQLAVEGLRYQAMARAYENRPGITAAGAALSNARHSAYSVPVTQTQATGSDDFNWSDSGIGALVAFGAALMLLMAVVLGRRVRSRPTGLAST